METTTSSTNSSTLYTRPLEFTLFETITLIISLSTIFIVLLFSIATNIIAIRIFLTKKLTTPKLLYISISVSDLIFLLTSLFSIFIDSSQILNFLINHISAFVSTYTMALIAFHRYKAIAYPMQNQPGRKVGKSVIISIVLIWILSIAFSTLFQDFNIFGPTPEENTFFSQMCRLVSTPVKATKHVPFFTLIMMVIFPLAMGLVFSLLAIYKLSFHGTENNIIKRKQLKSVFIILIVIVTFGVCWIPVSVYFAVEGVLSGGGGCDYNYVLYAIFGVLLMIQFTANPIIFWAMDSGFRNGVTLIWEKLIKLIK